MNSFPFEAEVEVTFRDIDAMGHVNNAIFFSYFEIVRVKYVMQLFGSVEDLLEQPLILVRAECDYKSPALMGEKLLVGTGITKLGNKSFDLVYEIRGENGRLIATGKTVQVMYNYETASAYAIPDAVRAKVTAIQGDWAYTK